MVVRRWEWEFCCRNGAARHQECLGLGPGIELAWAHHSCEEYTLYNDGRAPSPVDAGMPAPSSMIRIPAVRYWKARQGSQF
ncbi:hypothetical protein PISMIDRAFT_678086 [Pisolithus microcarpus 441]|uniref:Uncharacterized protein n=1 Tax=Pisolithus microcarpus 441 TaxID=765257 RepID=A0A0C9YI25_9AGAM|nr:hypothetical protein PISMIDRAFT_678086 [Pisolithus microcarpus 441]